MALERDSWEGPDDLRPLSPAGWRQALALAELLGSLAVRAHYSSPARRCRDTLLPLAHRLGQGVTADPQLAEGIGGPGGDRARLLRELLSSLFVREALGGTLDGVTTCTHGDRIPQLLEGAGVSGSRRCPKGGVWRLDLGRDLDRVEGAVYLGRPGGDGGWDLS